MQLSLSCQATFPKSQLVTGWRRLIGCRQLQVIFRKRATNYMALVQKMTYKDKASFASSPPCTEWTLWINHQADFWEIYHQPPYCKIPFSRVFLFPVPRFLDTHQPLLSRAERTCLVCHYSSSTKSLFPAYFYLHSRTFSALISHFSHEQKGHARCVRLPFPQNPVFPRFKFRVPRLVRSHQP